MHFQSTSKCYSDRAGNKSAFKIKTDAMFKSVKRHCHERVKSESSKDQVNIHLNSKERDGEYFSTIPGWGPGQWALIISVPYCSVHCLTRSVGLGLKKPMILIKPLRDKMILLFFWHKEGPGCGDPDMVVLHILPGDQHNMATSSWWDPTVQYGWNL